MELTGAGSVKIVAEASMSHRTRLGYHQLLSACRASCRIGVIENANLGMELADFWDEILHDALAVAALAAACIESYANELYFNQSYFGEKLSSLTRETLFEVVDRKSALEKYEIALAFRSDVTLDYGRPPVQDALLLFRLRNAVMHFHLEWSHADSDHAKLSRSLRGRFAPSPFIQKEPVFPKAWASHSFSLWAVRTAYRFIEHFHILSGTANPLSRAKPKAEGLLGCAI